jgi:hypothetical protein
MPNKQPHPRGVDGFCQRNGIGRSTFYSELHSGDLEVTKIGARTIITPEQEAAWLERKRGGKLLPARGRALQTP